MAGLTDEEIRAIMLAPKRVESDEGKVETHNPKDIIALDRYQNSKVKIPFLSMCSRIAPPGGNE